MNKFNNTVGPRAAASDEDINAESINASCSGAAINTDEEEEKKKKRRLIILIIFFIILFLISEGILLYRLGGLAQKNIGKVVDTIVLSPEQSQEIPLSLCGRIQYSDGTPAAGLTVELHSDPMTDTTDENGDFYFNNVEYGSHTLTVTDKKGNKKVLADLDIQRDSAITDGKQIFTLGSDGIWHFKVPDETLNIEFNIQTDDDLAGMNIIQNTVSAMLTDSRVMTYYGSKTATDGEPVISLHGSVMLSDGTLHLHEDGVILPDGLYINTDGEIYRNGEKTARSALPGDYELDTGNLTVTTPDGSVIHLKDPVIELPGGNTISGTSGGQAAQPGSRGNSGSSGNNNDNASNNNNSNSNASTGNNNGGNNNAGGRPDNGSNSNNNGGANNGAGQDGPQNGGNNGNSGNGGGSDNNNSGGNNGDSGNGGGTGGGSVGGDEDRELNVVDKNTGLEWRQLTTIDLFKNGGTISPGASAEYDFYIRNGVKSKVRFKMTIEEAEHEAGPIPLEYRLRDSSGYIAGTADNKNGWLTASELEAVWVTLSERGSLNYTLEWRWPYERGSTAAEIAANDAADTALGNSANSEHYIHLKIYAEAVN